MRIENLYPKPVRDDFATCAQVRDLLDRSGGDAIGAISLLMLAADQRKAQEISKAAEPTLSEQALAATVREQRDTIDTLKSQVNLYRDQWQTAANNAASLNADLAQREVDAEQITRLQSILCAATATAYGRARMYGEDLHALPIGTVVRDEADQAWTRIDDEDGGVWATPTGDDTLSSADLVAGSSIYLAWVADK
jgi:hypothetical protein